MRLKQLIIISILGFSSLIYSNNDFQKLRQDTTGYENSKSPLKALLLSAVLPGAGQFYNESYLKIPIIWGIGGWLIYNWINNNNQYLDYRDLYLKSVEQGQSNSFYKQLREFFRDQRDLFAIYIGILYFLNILDAYVDAQLFDFNVENSSQLKFNIRVNFDHRFR